MNKCDADTSFKGLVIKNSLEYQNIIRKAKCNWPKWKRDAYNYDVAVLKTVKKITIDK